MMIFTLDSQGPGACGPGACGPACPPSPEDVVPEQLFWINRSTLLHLEALSRRAYRLPHCLERGGDSDRGWMVVWGLIRSHCSCSMGCDGAPTAAEQ